MRRVDYRATWAERVLGVAPPAGVPAALRGPLASVACALAFAGVLQGVEHARMASAERDGDALARAVAHVQPALDATHRLAREVARLRARDDATDALRASGRASAGELVRITDRLPDGVWLTSVRLEPATVALEGRSARLDGVAAALAALEHGRGARLLSVRAQPAGRGFAYALAVPRLP